MSTHNIGFYEDLTKIIFEISNYHQTRTLFLLLRFTRKHVLGVSNQVLHKPGCRTIEGDKRLEISNFFNRGIVISQKQTQRL